MYSYFSSKIMMKSVQEDLLFYHYVLSFSSKYFSQFQNTEIFSCKKMDREKVFHFRQVYTIQVDLVYVCEI